MSLLQNCRSDRAHWYLSNLHRFILHLLLLADRSLLCRSKHGLHHRVFWQSGRWKWALNDNIFALVQSLANSKLRWLRFYLTCRPWSYWFRNIEWKYLWSYCLILERWKDFIGSRWPDESWHISFDWRSLDYLLRRDIHFFSCLPDQWCFLFLHLQKRRYFRALFRRLGRFISFFALPPLSLFLLPSYLICNDLRCPFVLFEFAYFFDKIILTHFISLVCETLLYKHLA
jgi:hypothetical protein